MSHTPSNLPPGVSGGVFFTEVQFSCENQHCWIVPAYSELGGIFVQADFEEMAIVCPVCGKPDIDNVEDFEDEAFIVTDSDLIDWQTKFVYENGVATATVLVEYYREMAELDAKMAEWENAEG